MPATAQISISDASRARIDRLQSFLAQDPDNLNLLADLGDEAIKCGDLATARAAVEHALELQPGDPYFSLRLSSIAIGAREFDEAIAITARLLEAGHRDAAVRYNQAYALVSAGRFAEAKELLVELHGEDAANAMVVRLLIRAHHYLGELDAAIDVARRDLEAHPEDGEVAGMLSLLYFDTEDLAQAREWSLRALSQAPDSIDALLAAGGVTLAEENADETRMLMQRAVQVQPRNGRAWTNLGLADMLNLDLDAARASLTRAVEYMPEHIGTWHVLGWVQLMQRDIDGAEATFQRALAIDDNFGETHGGLAAVAASRGQWDKAEIEAKIARRLDPSGMSSQYVQMLQLQRDGRNDAAQQLIESVLKHGKAPTGGSLLDMVGRIARNKHPKK